MLSSCGEIVVTSSEDLYEVGRELMFSKIKTDNGLGKSTTFMGSTIDRVHDNTIGMTRDMVGEDRFDGDPQGIHVECLKHDLSHFLLVSFGTAPGSLPQVIEGDCTDSICGKEVEERSWFWEVGGGGGDGLCFVGGGGGGLCFLGAKVISRGDSVFYTPSFQTLENTGAIRGDVQSHSPACKILLEYFYDVVWVILL